MSYVLVVDDNLINIYMLETLLKSNGFEVETAENGREALIKANLNSPSLIISDILMPIMDGYTLCQIWKKDLNLNKIPFIFYTATYTESKDEAFALSIGADRFLLKPQEPEILMNVIHQVLDKNYQTKQILPKPLGEEMETFRQYNEILFRKLEKKMIDLQVSILELKKSEEKVQYLNTDLESKVKERTSQLEEANKELESFAYSVSHDLRAPLRAINGFTRMIQDSQTSKIDEKSMEYLSVIVKNAQKMDQLITDLLTISRTAKIELKKSLIDVTSLVDSIFLDYSSSELYRKFTMINKITQKCFGDSTLIHQVWSNLISNSIKYSMPKPNPEITVGDYLEDGSVVFFIKDNGVGFNNKYSSKLFGVFQRLHTSSEFEGSGVGLAIVQRIISRHGGKVWAEGEEGVGATFYFSLPIETT